MHEENFTHLRGVEGVTGTEAETPDVFSFFLGLGITGLL